MKDYNQLQKLVSSEKIGDNTLFYFYKYKLLGYEPSERYEWGWHWSNNLQLLYDAFIQVFLADACFQLYGDNGVNYQDDGAGLFLYYISLENNSVEKYSLLKELFDIVEHPEAVTSYAELENVINKSVKLLNKLGLDSSVKLCKFNDALEMLKDHKAFNESKALEECFDQDICYY